MILSDDGLMYEEIRHPAPCGPKDRRRDEAMKGHVCWSCVKTGGFEDKALDIHCIAICPQCGQAQSNIYYVDTKEE